jgi:uncharacterized cupredoxin-like copper-binding protein
MRAWWAGALSALALAATMLLGGALLAGQGSTTEVTIAIHYSGFDPTVIAVPVGEPVHISLVNRDPIEHEWIVGDAAVHERHRTGTEPHHAARPTEVSIPPLETRETTVVFDEPGTYLYICHLPGHEAYGMVGRIVAVER